jgi:hypothetical protein
MGRRTEEKRAFCDQTSSHDRQFTRSDEPATDGRVKSLMENGRVERMPIKSKSAPEATMAEEEGGLHRRRRIEQLIDMIYNEPDPARRAALIHQLASEESARPRTGEGDEERCRDAYPGSPSKK